MPAAGGPNTLGESNLVFAYDTGDVSNSYKGQPTVNVLPSNAVLLTSYNDHGGTHVTDTGFTLFGNATLRNTSNPAQDWNGVYLTGLSSILTPGVTYTYSFYIYFTSDNTTISYFGYGAPGYTGVKGRWNRVSTTFTATSQDYFYVTLQYSNGQPVSTYYLANLQIEQKSNPTQFVNGTRSATQGLLPLIGNSTIDLSNVSFDSSAQMVFDGTDDYVNVPYNTSHNLTSQGTISAWINPSTLTQGNFAGIVAQCTGGSVNTQAYQLSWRQVSNGIYGAICNGSGTYNEVLAAFPSTANVWYNIVFTWNGAQLVLYINGVASSTTTQTINNQVLSTDLTIGGFTYKGAGGGAEYFNGSISKVELYNRGLTAQEVRQNYQQHKTRFNLS